MTGEGKFTKGPWKVASKATGIIIAPDGSSTVQIGRVGSYSDKEILRFNKDRWDADAALIAAAPTMYSLIEKKAAEGDADAKAFMENFHGTA